MIAFKGEKPFCDLQCKVCGGWVMRDCLFGGFHMRMLAAQCLGRGVFLLDEFQIFGLWKENVVLDTQELNVTPPEYKNEMEH